MKSIERNFKKEMRKDKNIGEYPALVRAVRHKQYTRRTLNKNIHLLGDKDIDASMKKMLVDQLYKESQKVLEECINDSEISADKSVTGYLRISSSEKNTDVLG